MDPVVRILAVVYCDSGCFNFDINWSLYNEMILETIFGIVLSVIAPNDTAVDPASMIYKGVITGNKIIEKEKRKEIDDSIHEELHQMTKDFIYKIGDLK